MNDKMTPELSVQPVVTGCGWSTDGESDMWETTCGKAFVFNEDGPIANGFKFCPFCGLSLDELKRGIVDTYA